MDKTANEWIEQLDLKPHPEGGYYREVYRSSELIPAEALPERFNKSHVFGTSIYFLLHGKQISSLHRLKSDEIWHFYLGSPIRIVMLDENGILMEKLLGRDIATGQSLQVIIPNGWWFGAKVTDEKGYALVGCTVAPGFEFDDFELAKRADLLKLFPQHKEIINEFTH